MALGLLLLSGLHHPASFDGPIPRRLSTPSRPRNERMTTPFMS